MVGSVGGYPQWLVALVAVVAALVGLWVFIKLLKLALWMLFFGIIFVGAGAAVWMLLR